MVLDGSQVLVRKYAVVSEFSHHIYDRLGHFRWKLWQHLRLADDVIPGVDKLKAGCVRVSSSARLGSCVELLHQPQLSLHSIPGEERVSRRVGVAASGCSAGGQF